MFVGERLELLDGVLVVREPQGSVHAAIVTSIGQVLAAAFGGGWHPRLQAPLALVVHRDPQPPARDAAEDSTFRSLEVLRPPAVVTPMPRPPLASPSPTFFPDQGRRYGL